MPRKLDPQTKQNRAELRERKAQLRVLTKNHLKICAQLRRERAAEDKAYLKARTELDNRIAIITGRFTK